MRHEHQSAFEGGQASESSERAPEPEQEAADHAAARRASFAQLQVFRSPQRGREEVDETAAIAGLAQPTGGGSPLPAPVQTRMEQGFGTSLDGVRVHTDGDSEDAAEQLGARAFAIGPDLHFNRGEYAPGTETGDRLLAHELTHTVQQQHGGGEAVQAKGRVVAADDAAELEADRVADKIVGGASNVEVKVAPASANAVHLDRKKNSKKKEKELPDWEVKRPDGDKKPKDKDADMPDWYREGEDRDKESWQPEIVADPPGTHVALGSQFTQKFSVRNSYEAPARTKYKWKHNVAGTDANIVGKSDTSGEDASLAVRANEVGGGAVQTALAWDPPGKAKGGTVDDAVGFNVPAPALKGTTLQTSNKADERRPFFDQMMLGEYLIITAQFDGVDPARIDHALAGKVIGGGLKYMGAKVLGPGIYEIKLLADKQGEVNANVYALPYTSSPGQMPAIPVKATVDLEGDGKEDSRPVSVQAAKEWLEADYEALSQSQMGGLSDLVKQTQERDPPAKPSMLENILMACASVALQAVSAGVGMHIAGALVKDHASKMFEMTKTFFENIIPTAVNGAAGMLASEFPTMAAPIAFHRIQEESLIALERKHKQQVLSNRVYPMIDELEAKQPGSGFEAAVELDRALKQQQAAARTAQYDESFSQWCVFMAKAQLNNKNPEDATKGTMMGGEVDVDNVEHKAAIGGGYTWYELDPKFGVLNIEIDVPNDPDSPTKIKHAEMKGLNKALQKKVGETPIKDLKFPVTAYDGSSIVIGRNEEGTVWASQAHYAKKIDVLGKRGGGSAEEGARKILNEEIGNQKVVPRDEI